MRCNDLGRAERLVELGVLQLDEEGHFLGDSGLLARANELLATGNRVRVMADVGEVSALGARVTGEALLRVAADNGGADPRALHRPGHLVLPRGLAPLPG